MLRLALLSSLAAASALAAPWEIDSSHASATFSVKHFGVSNVNGTLGAVTGMVELDDADPSKGKIDATIDVKAIDTKWAKRDEHLRSADFFEVDKFPSMTFKSTKIVKVSKTKLKVTGDLTIHGVTKPVTLDTEVSPEIKNPFSGNPVRAVTASALINRQDFGLKWQAPAEAVKVVGDEVKVAIELELVQKPSSK
jgi:polyisoprenoid-binding protein YceI